MTPYSALPVSGAAAAPPPIAGGSASPLIFTLQQMSSGHGRGRGGFSSGGETVGNRGRGSNQDRAQTSRGGRGRALAAGTAIPQQHVLTTSEADASSAMGPIATGAGRERLRLVQNGNNKFFSPSFKSAKVISEIFKSSMHKEGFAWKLVPEDKKMDYFEQFKKRYYWEPTEEGPIKKFWMTKAGVGYKNMICDFKKAYLAKGVKPSCIPETDWEWWKAYWARPDVELRSSQAKKCRLSQSEEAEFAIATHYGGSKCANEHAIALERVYELAHERKELQDSNEEGDIDMNKIFIEVGMEHMSKGRIIGMGDRASLYTSGSRLTGGSQQVSSAINTEAMTQQLASLQTELEAEKNERTRLMEQVQAERDGVASWRSEWRSRLLSKKGKLPSLLR